MNDQRVFQTSEKGQSLMEMAVSLVVLLILLAGIVDLGRAFFTFVSLRDAAQEAAIYASAYPNDCANILQRAQDALTDANYTSISIQIGTYTCGTTPPVDQACAGNTVRVIAQNEHFPITMPFLGSLIGTQEVTIRSEITDTILRPPCN